MPDALGRVFITRNRGATWQSFKGNGTGFDLPNVPVNVIRYDPGDLTNNTLYAGTDLGIYRTTDGGQTWPGSAGSVRPGGALVLETHARPACVRCPDGTEKGVKALTVMLVIGVVGLLFEVRGSALARIRLRLLSVFVVACAVTAVVGLGETAGSR